MDKDVTKQVTWWWADEGSLSIKKCVCGCGFTNSAFQIYQKDDFTTKQCPICGRKLYWVIRVKELGESSPKEELASGQAKSS